MSSHLVIHLPNPCLILLSDNGGTVNESLLRVITNQTHGYYGKLSTNSAHVISQAEADYVITSVMPVVDGGDDSALVELFTDADFTTVPDWRLPDVSWWPLRETGVLVSG